MSVIDRFSTRRVAEITGLSVSRIQQFDKSGILQPSLRGRPGPANQGLYSVEDLVTLNAIGQLATAFRLRKQEIERACAWLAERYPEKPWSVFRFERVGDAVILKDDDSELRMAVNAPGQAVLEIPFEKIEEVTLAQVTDLSEYRVARSSKVLPALEEASEYRSWVNKLILGDNLDILRASPDDPVYIPSESVDLVYLDPPFNSNATYNQLFKEHSGEVSAAQMRAFDDTWKWSLEAERTYQEVVLTGGKLGDVLQAFRTFLGQSDMMAYITMMAPRLAELHRVLKPAGSIYLHCDPTASHYLKVIMDTIWGPEHFRNEVVWKRTHAHGGAKRYGPIHDVLLYYAKSDNNVWNPQHTPYSEDYVRRFFRFTDEDGRRYRSTILTGSGTRGGESGKPWRGIDPTAIGRHWAIPGYVRPLLSNPRASVLDALDELDRIGRVLWPEKKDGTPSFKQYLDDLDGVPLQDIWTDIPPISAKSAERLGYPTQKPETLLERIIRASSDPGDLVLDPFAGCGTATVVAEKLGRRWIGIDISDLALAVMTKRLHETFADDELRPFEVVGDPTDAPSAKRLAARDPFRFEWWAVRMLRAQPRNKKGADRGIDGVIQFFAESTTKAEKLIIQVKGGRPSVRDVRDLRGVIEREKAAIGVLVLAQPPTRDMEQEAVGAGFYAVRGIAQADYPKIQILTVDDLFAGVRIEYPRYGHIDGYGQAPRRQKARNQQQRIAS